MENQPNPLPLLSVALHEMWRHRQGDRLTLKAYAEGGRVTGTLADMAEGAVSPFLPRHEALVRATLLRLVFFAPALRPPGGVGVSTSSWSETSTSRSWSISSPRWRRRGAGDR